MDNLSNKVALITGGSKGIGFGTANALLVQGMRVIITSRTKAAAEKAASMLDGAGDKVIGVGADVRDPSQLQDAVRTAVDRWGSIDVLVANAGLGHFGSIETLTADQWNETIDTNLTGVFHSVKACLEELKKSKGYIVTIASLAGANFFAGGSAYNASKFGLVGFSQAMMLDLRNYGVKVTTIMPGSVATEFGFPGSAKDDSWKIQPEDIGQIVVDLLKMHPRTLPSKVEVRPTIPR